MTTSATQPAKSPIVFGTDGWRARIAEDFTFENVRRCADGVARYVAGRGEQAKGVVIAYDRRFASEHFAIDYDTIGNGLTVPDEDLLKMDWYVKGVQA